ncbi:MAG TPA: hypothetical protein PLD02_13215 [Saprospiraceae bacterium]|nr:hypothetical protein [Saprospiraceae bacterium]
MELIEFSKKIAAFKKEANGLFSLKNVNKPTLFKTKEHKIGIITSTLDEFESIAKYLDPLDELEINFDDSTIYYSGIIKNKHGSVFNVIIPFPTSMGIESTVCCTTKIISIFNPQYLFMVGVAAGNKNVTKIGDVIIAEKSLNYNEITEIQKE